MQGLDKCIEFIEKNRKEKAKAKAKKVSDAKKAAEKSDKPVKPRASKGQSTEKKKDGEKSRVKKIIKKKTR